MNYGVCHNQEQFHKCSTDRVAEVRGLVPDQQVIEMNICKEKCVDKRLYCGPYSDTSQFSNNVFSFFAAGEAARVEGKYEGRGK